MDLVGSVGVMMSFVDMQPAHELKGVKFHKLVSNLSPDKNSIMEKVRAGQYDEYKKEFLDPIAERFIANVTRLRPNAKTEHLTGKVFMSKDVKGIFIDEISSWENTLNKAIDSPYQPQQQTSKKHTKMNIDALTNLLGAIEATQEGAHLTVEQLEAINEAIAQESVAADQLATVTADLETANASIATQAEELETATARIEELEAQVADMSNDDGGTATAAPKGEEQIPEPGASAANTDELAHNRAADKYFE
jgi:ClpP class serine protease